MLVYRVISWNLQMIQSCSEPLTESESLQVDLGSVSNWAKWWQMEFNFLLQNARLCITGRKQSLQLLYECARDWRRRSREGSWGHVLFWLERISTVQKTHSKANRILSLVNRTMKYKNSATLISLHKSMVRSLSLGVLLCCMESSL